MIIRRIRVNPRRVAATAPQLTAEQAAEREADRGLPPAVADMCQEWGRWVATRHIAAPRPLGSVLGRLRTVAAVGTGDGPRLWLDAHVAAFHAALQMQTEQARAVLYGLYALPVVAHQRVPVKRIADALEISRRHVYRVRNDAATQAFSMRHAVLEEQQQLVAGARAFDQGSD